MAKKSAGRTRLSTQRKTRRSGGWKSRCATVCNAPRGRRDKRIRERGVDSHLPRHLVLVDELSTVAECLSTPFLWKELRVHSHIAFKDPVPVTKKIDKMQLDLEDTDILDVEDLKALSERANGSERVKGNKGYNFL